MNSIRILLQSAIDFAGLFPPSALKMADAVREYSKGRTGEFAWALGRFVLPAFRLDEFEAEAAAFLPRTPGQPWRLTVLGGSDRSRDLNRIRSFNQNHAADSGAVTALVDAIEAKVRNAQEIHHATGTATARLDSYFEIPLSEDMPALIATIARTGTCAKVRTGGLTQEQFPSVAELSRFVHLCAQSGITFKATAGLHHPFRAIRRLNYEPASPSCVMHGFLNLLLAAAFAREGMEASGLEKVLDDRAVDAFKFDDEGATWRTERLSIARLLDARQHCMVSFGSCSLHEPWEDLKALKLL